MANRDEIDALLTEIGTITEDGTECLLSRGMGDAGLRVLIAATAARIEALKALIGLIISGGS